MYSFLKVFHVFIYFEAGSHCIALGSPELAICPWLTSVSQALGLKVYIPLQPDLVFNFYLYEKVYVHFTLIMNFSCSSHISNIKYHTWLEANCRIVLCL